MEIEFIRSRQEADQIITYQFTRPPALDFDAGDYVELATIEPFADRRWLSICNSPHEEVLEFTTKIHPEMSQFKQSLDSLSTGSKVVVSPAIGNFNLPKDSSKKLLWIAGGIGITPFRSMARWLNAHYEKRDITLLYVARDLEHIFTTDLQSAAKVHALHSRTELMRELGDEKIWQEKIIYLSGPEPFCINLYNYFVERGVAKKQLRLDYFPGYETI